jgi:hypothetical protein
MPPHDLPNQARAAVTAPANPLQRSSLPKRRHPVAAAVRLNLPRWLAALALLCISIPVHGAAPARFVDDPQAGVPIGGAQTGAVSAGAQTPTAASAPAAPLEVPRAVGQAPLLVPRAERLQYEVRLSLGLVDARVGTVTLDSSVEPYRRSLLRPGANTGAGRETGVLRARAFGEYTLYTLDHTLETRLLPQAWPRISASSDQQGTEKRRSELLLGERNGVPGGSYRNDTKHGAPRGSRVWGQPQEVTAPQGALDSLGSILLLRTMCRDQSTSERLVMVDKLRCWQVELTLGETAELELPAGRFSARPVTLTTSPWQPEGSDQAVEPAEFSGPFGLRGNIQLWVEAVTGVPLLIQGNLPAGPINVDIAIRLEKHSGTPAEFQPAAAEPAAGQSGGQRKP